MTRRSLVSSLAVSGAFATTARIKVAVVGTSHGHAMSKIRALRAMPEYEFAGVCRPDSSEPEGGLRDIQWLSLRQIVDDASIELVVCESDDVLRNVGYAEQFVEAGKFVHLDKPPVDDLERLRKLFENARNRNRSVQLGFQWRFHPAMQAVVEAARNGWLGKVYRFRASIDKLIGAEERRHLAKFPGGMMFSEGCHLVDRAVAVLGKPAKVTGFLRHDGAAADGLADNTLAILEYPGAIAEISLAGFHGHGNAYRFLEVLGTNGSARMQPYTFPSQLTVDVLQAAGPYKAGAQTIQVPAPPGPGYSPDFLEMAAIIRQGAKPSHSVEHDLATHETLLRVCGMYKAK